MKDLVLPVERLSLSEAYSRITPSGISREYFLEILESGEIEVEIELERENESTGRSELFWFKIRPDGLKQIFFQLKRAPDLDLPEYFVLDGYLEPIIDKKEDSYCPLYSYEAKDIYQMMRIKSTLVQKIKDALIQNNVKASSDEEAKRTDRRGDKTDSHIIIYKAALSEINQIILECNDTGTDNPLREIIRTKDGTTSIHASALARRIDDNRARYRGLRDESDPTRSPHGVSLKNIEEKLRNAFNFVNEP